MFNLIKRLLKRPQKINTCILCHTLLNRFNCIQFRDFRGYEGFLCQKYSCHIRHYKNNEYQLFFGAYSSDYGTWGGETNFGMQITIDKRCKIHLSYYDKNGMADFDIDTYLNDFKDKSILEIYLYARGELEKFKLLC